MKYIIDAEFIDTPTCSALISFAILREDGAHRYFEFFYPEDEITPWLKENVVPHLGAIRTSFAIASQEIERFVGDDRNPEFWAYYGAYDWYWFCRLWGGFMNMPQPHWPMTFREFAYIQQSVLDVAGEAHHALNDCRSILHAMRGLV